MFYGKPASEVLIQCRCLELKYINFPLAGKVVQADELWKAHRMDFPILSQMNCNILPVRSTMCPKSCTYVEAK